MKTLVLVDGQNLFHLAKNAWGPDKPYNWPSYDVLKLANSLVSREPGRILSEIRFYTGVPDQNYRPDWHAFWTRKLRGMLNQGIYVYRGRVSAGGQEKGVDVSLALDLVRATYEQHYDAAIIVSQDSDFLPAVRLAREIASSQTRSILIESAFPYLPGKGSARGVPETKWVHIDKATYDACLDPRDYRQQT